MLQITLPYRTLPICTLERSRAPNLTELLYLNPACSLHLIVRDEAKNLFWLDDAQWNAIAPLLPSRATGPKRSDDRVVISGIVHVLIGGIAWRDRPVDYGPYMTVFNRFNRWKHRGLWNRISDTLTAPGVAALSDEQKNRLGAAIAAPLASSLQHRSSRRHSSPNRNWDEAAAELRRIAHAHHGKPIAAWVDAVVEWHMDALFAEAEKHRSERVPQMFDTEMNELRRIALDLIIALRTYVDDPDRTGAKVAQQLGKLRYELMQAQMGPPRQVRTSYSY